MTLHRCPYEKNAVEAAFWEEELLGHCLGTSFRR